MTQKYDEVDRTENLHISNFEWTAIEELAVLISKECDCGYTKGQKKDTVQLNLQYEPDKNILKYWKPTTTLEDGILKIINELYPEQ